MTAIDMAPDTPTPAADDAGVPPTTPDGASSFPGTAQADGAAAAASQLWRGHHFQPHLFHPFPHMMAADLHLQQQLLLQQQQQAAAGFVPHPAQAAYYPQQPAAVQWQYNREGL
jgi:hypothetical protein